MRKPADIPVIFLTAKSEIEDERQGFEVGAVDYITKPVSPPIALARVKTQMQLKNARDFLKEKIQRQIEENHLVAHLMAQMMHSPGLRDDQIRYWISASDLVSAISWPPRATSMASSSSCWPIPPDTGCPQR